MKLKSRYSIEFAASSSAVPALIALLHSLNGGAMVQAAVVRSAVTFVAFFLFLLTAQLTAVRERGGNLELSPWFVWFTVGGVIVFLVGTIAAGHLLAGLAAVGVWLVVVLSVQALTRIWKHKKA